MTRGEEIVALALRRREILASLEEPLTKRELVEKLDISRSTVDRAIRQLEVEGLVTWADDSYRLTAVGRGMRSALERLLAVSDGIDSVVEGVGPIPTDIAFPPSLLADGTVRSVTPGDHGLPRSLRERIETADDIGLVTPAETAPAVLACCRELSDCHIDAVIESSFVDELAERLPGIARWIAGSDRIQLRSSDVPPLAVLVIATGDESTVVVVAYDDNGQVTGCLESSDADTVEWGRRLVTEAATAGTEAFDPVHVTGGDIATNDRLAEEGIVELSPSYFSARVAAPLSTSWRTGLSLSEVAAGQAVDRTLEVDGERRSLVGELFDRLEDGGDIAVLGAPGAGKSTVCKAVACEWYRERGPVFYRESGASEPFESWPLLAERLQSVEGHALVVVEDAVRPDANAVFRLMQAFPQGNVTFLLDARKSEWNDPVAKDALPDGFRAGVDFLELPPLDKHDTERLLDRFESAVGDLGVSASRLLEDIEDDPERPATLLCVLHRLSLLADPLGDDGATSLDEAVREVASALRTVGELPADAGILLNICNAAGLEVAADLVAALAPDDPEAVRETLEVLEGRLLFVDPDGEGYRTVHEAWSAQYLLAATEADDITERTGRGLSRLLALADDGETRNRIAEAFPPAPTMSRIDSDPGAWADDTVERLFTVGLERPNLTPLFGESDPDPIAFPTVCSSETVIDVVYHRARMARYSGELDRAEREYERLYDRAKRLLGSDESIYYAAKRENGLGTVARKRSDFEAAIDHYERAEELYEDIGDEHGIADARKNLGTVALLRGDLETAKDHLEWSHERFRELGDERLASYSRFNLASVLEELGDIEGAIERYRECLADYQRFGRVGDEADVHLNLGVTLVIRGDVPGAADHYAEALRIYRDIGDDVGVANSLQNHGEVALERENLEDAATYYERSRERYEAVGEEWGVVQCRLALADIALRRGSLDDAEAAASETLERLKLIGDSRGTMDARRVLAGVARERGAFERGEEHLEASLETGREGRYSHRKGRTLLAYGDLERARGDDGAARDRYREAVDVLEDAGALGELGEALEELAATCEELGENEAAASHRERIEAVATRVSFDLPVAAD